MNTRLLVFATAFAVSSSPLVADETLGRLFFTPEKRQALDYQRQFNIQEKQEAQEDPTLTIDGVVMRSSGGRTVWINGVALDTERTDSGVAVTASRTNPGKVIVRPDGGPAAKASVGDTVYRSSGETVDLLGGGTLKVPPAAR